MTEDITIEPTPVQVAELVAQCNNIPELGVTARRLAYQFGLLIIKPDKLAVRKGIRHIEGDEIPYWVVQNKYGEILAHCEEEHIAEHFAQRGDLPDA